MLTSGDRQHGTALITGASSGIGAIYADRLARRGYSLILVGRNRERLEMMRTRLANDTGGAMTVLAADLSAPSDLARVECMLATDASITVLVNNAGVGSTAPLADTDVDVMEQMIRVNVNALVRLTSAAVQPFLLRGEGTIINIGSIVGVVPELLNGVYGATKAFVLAFSQSLHKELATRGIRVQAVLPGATATPFWSAAGTPLDRLPREIVMTAGDVVDAAIAGLDLGELVTIPSLPDYGDWQNFEAARQNMIPNLSLSTPATRYRQFRGVHSLEPDSDEGR